MTDNEKDNMIYHLAAGINSECPYKQRQNFSESIMLLATKKLEWLELNRKSFEKDVEEAKEVVKNRFK